VRVGIRWLAAALCALNATAALSHHSVAAYDLSRAVDTSGTVKEFFWTSPHSFLEVVVPTSSGGTELWTFETGTPNSNARAGWRKDSIKPGDRIRVTFIPSKDGSLHGLLRTLVLPDGKVLRGDGESIAKSVKPADPASSDQPVNN
jgi:hypothetical protein